MSEETARPLPQNLAQAFQNAIAAFQNSASGGDPDPDISLDLRPVPISAVFNIVSYFSDQMPERLRNIVLDCLDDDLRPELELACSFGAGARCMAKMIQRRIDRQRS